MIGPVDAALWVLLIEDDPGFAELMRRALDRADERLQFHWSATLHAGLDHAATERVDVILADLSLPDSNHLNTVTTLRAELPEIPVVVLTALANDQTASEAIDLGAQDYLVKHDVNPEILRRSIRYAIQRQLSAGENIKLLEKLRDSKKLLERKNRRLSRLFKTAQKFVDNVSHEFRTPLTAIKEYASLLGANIVGPVNGEQARMLNVVVDRADDLNTMVDDMLDVSRLEAGLLGVWRRKCHLKEVVDHVLPSLERKAAVRGVHLETHVDDRLPAVYCDEDKIGRVIINLIVNAIKFSGQPGRVVLTADGDEAHKEIVVCVADNGPGIDSEQAALVFKRFKQLDGETRSSRNGLGLGLNIAQELVALNLGTIWVDSTPGVGSHFMFTIPVAEPAEITRRYLSRLDSTRQDSAMLSVISAHLDHDGEAVSEDVDAFLNYLLRRNDLLFRAHPSDWLFLLRAPEIEVDAFVARAETSRQSANRNRPHGPLPEIHFRTEGCWNAGSRKAEIVSFVNDYCQRSEVNCV